MREVACAVLVRDRRLLLGRRAPHRRAYPDCWDVIGGHLEPGETLAQALVREVREEIGLTPTRFRPAGELAEPYPERYGRARLHFFTVTAWDGGEPRMLGNEHTALCWFDVEAACALPELASSGYEGIFRAVVAMGFI